MKNKILLQINFLLLAFLNNSYVLVPNPLRSFYLRLYRFKLKTGACIHRSCKFFSIGKLTIGKDSTVNFGCYLDNRRGITIGNGVGIAHNTKIYTLGHDISSSKFETKGAPVVIEDKAFVFSNCLIMPGVTIHEGAVVLSGSVVTKDVQPYTVVGGNPAKYIKDRRHDLEDRGSYIYWFAL